MKLVGSLGNVPQKMKNLLVKNGQLVHFKSTIYTDLLSINCTLENGLTVRNISSIT
jgi:hypothetical protein